jgi:hypothetical protein
MADKPGTAELSAAIGISKGHASDILSEDSPRNPSRKLAIHIYRVTGWKHPTIADLTEEQMAVLEQVEPWTKAA